MTTRELLASPVRFTFYGMNVQALVASLRRVARVYQYQLHAELNRFVVEKLPQLVERPTIRPSPLRFGTWHLISAFSDSGQVFKGDDLPVVLGISDNAVRDDVVHMFLKALLFARQPFQQVSNSSASRPGALRGFLLELCSQITVMVPDFGDVFAAKRFPVRRDSDIGSAQIDTQNLIGLFRWLWVRFKLNHQVVFALSVLGQRGSFRRLPLQLAALKVADMQLKPLSLA